MFGRLPMLLVQLCVVERLAVQTGVNHNVLDDGSKERF